VTRVVRIVGVKFLNARPLLAGLEAGIPAPFPYAFSTAEPAACAEALAAGTAELGLVPVGALPFLSAVRALPNLGVASRHEVTSVLLVSRTPLEDVRILAAHSASRTSVVLARLLLAARWGAFPAIRTMRPPLEDMLHDADAAVIIGDPALAVRGRTGMTEIDLAAAWVEWTGQPFVFAVWGLTATAPEGSALLMSDSLTFAEAHWKRLVPAWSSAHGVEQHSACRYLEQSLVFRLGDEERQGMENFLRLAANAGLLPERDEVWHVG
jgi:chorismate dehydratase